MQQQRGQDRTQHHLPASPDTGQRATAGTAEAAKTAGTADTAETANDRFKRGTSELFWYSIAVAAVCHLMVFALWPQMTAADMTLGSDELVAIELPPEVQIPPPPEQIARPATPVVSASALDDVTAPPTRFDLYTPDDLAPPPATTRHNDDLAATPRFVPMTVRPELQNRAEIERVLLRSYPPMLRAAGIGGTPVLWFFIDENGRVLDTRVHTSSGYPDLDAAAQKVAEHMRFSPAYNRTERIPVWVELPVNFRAR
jgi:TonB family protein